MALVCLVSRHDRMNQHDDQYQYNTSADFSSLREVGGIAGDSRNSGVPRSYAGLRRRVQLLVGPLGNTSGEWDG